MSNRKCNDCGTQLREDEGYWAEGRKKDVCSECYRDIVSDCTICGDEDVMPSDVSDYILCKAELSTTARRPPGIYLVIDRPFLSIPLVGTGSLHASDVLFIDKLPKRDDQYDISGHICKACSKPFARTYRAAYGGFHASGEYRRYKHPKMSALRFSKAGWEFMRDYTRSVILANPDMLRDLECDSVDEDADGHHLSYANANDWNEIKELYKLPDLPTYYEWVAVNRKGVKVYHTIPGSWYWMSLRPEPMFRNAAGRSKETFGPSSLPTYDSGGVYDYCSTGQFCKPAIIKAIDQGILTQQGIFVNGKELVCH